MRDNFEERLQKLEEANTRASNAIVTHSLYSNKKSIPLPNFTEEKRSLAVAGHDRRRLVEAPQINVKQELQSEQDRVAMPPLAAP